MLLCLSGRIDRVFSDGVTYHDLDGVVEGEDVTLGQELVDEWPGDEKHGGLVRRRLVQQLRGGHLEPPLDLVGQLCSNKDGG
jgi:hypothetical protein